LANSPILDLDEYPLTYGSDEDGMICSQAGPPILAKMSKSWHSAATKSKPNLTPDTIYRNDTNLLLLTHFVSATWSRSMIVLSVNRDISCLPYTLQIDFSVMCCRILGWQLVKSFMLCCEIRAKTVLYPVMTMTAWLAQLNLFMVSICIK
jgi:hypothetical protein